MKDRDRVLFESNPLPMWVYDLETYRFLEVNHAAVVHYGYSPQEFRSMTIKDIRPPADVDRLVQNVEQVSEGLDQAGVWRHIRKDGSLIYVEITSHTLEFEGRRAELVVAMDVTARLQAERALQESQAQFAGIFNSAMDAIIAIDQDQRIVLFNPAAEAMYRCKASEVIGTSLHRFLPDWVREQHGMLVHGFGESRLTRRSLHRPSLELICVRADGETFPSEISISLVELEGRKLYTAIVRDITERKQAEEALRLENERFLRFVDSNMVGITIADASGRITLANDYYLDLIGLTRQDLEAGRVNWRQVTPTEWLPADEKAIRELREHGICEPYEKEYVRGDGTRVPVYIADAILPGPGEQIAAFVINIAGLKRAERALKEKEQLLSEAERVGHIGSWSYDIGRDTLRLSDEAYHLLGAPREGFRHDLAGLLSLIYTPDRPQFSAWISGPGAGRQACELLVRVLGPDSELRYLQCRGAVEFDADGRPTRFVGTFQDVTERKLADIQIRQQIEQLSSLRKIDQAITSSFDLHFTLNTVLTQVRSQLQVDAAVILLLDAREQTLQFAAGQGMHTRAVELAGIPLGHSHAGRVARERRLVRLDLRSHPDDPLLTRWLGAEEFVSYSGVPLIAKGRVIGVLEVFQRVPFEPYPEWLDFLITLAGQAAIAIENAKLFEGLQRSNRELARAYDATIEGWSRALDLRDKETEGHTRRVTELTLALARRFGFSEEELLHIRRGALLHDIGKMGVPDHILHKAESLTEHEEEIMRKHAQYAYDLLCQITFLAPALDIPHCHHEKWDGSGYPRRLTGQEIPLAARLFAVADVWDALTSDRPYRLAWTEEQALEYIREQSGRHFDPQVVELFFSLIEELRSSASSQPSA